jgi:hypothetical protein
MILFMGLIRYYGMPPEFSQFFRIYNRIDIQQLHNDVLHFNNIVKWPLELHEPLRKFIKKDALNPWYIFDILEKAMVERNIVYRLWRRRRTTADRDRCKDSRWRVKEERRGGFSAITNISSSSGSVYNCKHIQHQHQ